MLRSRAEVSEIKSRKPVEEISRTESWFFAKLPKLDKPLARLAK